jgi:hypothetical protein
MSVNRWYKQSSIGANSGSFSLMNLVVWTGDWGSQGIGGRGFRQIDSTGDDEGGLD